MIKMRKVIISIIFSSSFCLVILYLFNSRYPLVTQKIGKWSVGYHFIDNPILKPDILGENVISYDSVDNILNSEGNYIADPFFIKEKDSFYLFVELKGKKNADIALFVSSDGLDYKYRGVVLDEPFHLSYPQVFNYKGEFYMLPETKQSGNVLLYKAEDFPNKWEIDDTLIRNVDVKDPSILLSENMNLIVTADDHMNQLLFTSDSLKGNWKEVENYTPKKGNETRPGGRFFQYRNEWYLPLQDRSLGYGSGISIYKLNNSAGNLSLQLSESRYLHEMEEVPWFNRGMHHLDIQKIDNSYYMVYDGDQNKNGEKAFQLKRTLKFIYSDIYNFLKGN